MIRFTILPLTLISAACMTSAASDPAAPEEDIYERKPAGTCDAAPAQIHVGKKVTEELGAQILSATTAKTLRWGPPDTAWTMDYREDRVNVRYDRDMIITAISCG